MELTSLCADTEDTGFVFRVWRYLNKKTEYIQDRFANRGAKSPMTAPVWQALFLCSALSIFMLSPFSYFFKDDEYKYQVLRLMYVRKSGCGQP
jgi:hypothetical protein